MPVNRGDFKEIMHFHFMTYMTTPKHKNPCRGGHLISNFGRPFLVHYYYILSLSEPCSKVENFFFKRIIYQFYHVYPKITSLLGWGLMKFTVSRLLTLQMLYTKFG